MPFLGSFGSSNCCSLDFITSSCSYLFLRCTFSVALDPRKLLKDKMDRAEYDYIDKLKLTIPTTQVSWLHHSLSNLLDIAVVVLALFILLLACYLIALIEPLP